MVSQLTKNIINFVLGGACIVGIGNLAIYVNSTAAALLWSFPVLTIPAYIYIYLEQNDKNLLLDLNSDILIFFFVNLAFFGFIYCLVVFTDLTIPQLLAVAVTLYFIVAFGTYFGIRKFRGLNLL